MRTYDAWGQVRGAPSGDGKSVQLGFQGDPQDYDATAPLGQTTGLVDMTTRYYLPSLGRFTTRDALLGDPLDPASLNQFVYGQDSPVTFWDPLGMYVRYSGGGGGSDYNEPGHHHHPVPPSGTSSSSGETVSEPVPVLAPAPRIRFV